MARNIGEVADPGDAVPDSGSAGSWSNVRFCCVYRDVGAPRSDCGVGRLLGPVVCFDFLLLLLDVVLRLSLSLVRRVRTGSFELS